MRTLRSALVLGGAGFLGSWLVEVLQAERISTTVVDDLSTGRAEQAGTADLILGDVCEVDLPEIIVDRSVDVVFHLAGPAFVPPSLSEPARDLHRNAGVTLAVLEGLRRLEAPPVLGFASSAAVYGNGSRMPMKEDHPLQPMSPYGVAKLAAEQYVRLYSGLYGLPAFSARIFSLYGPRQRKQVVYDLLTRAFAGQEPLSVLGSPDVTRDFVFVEDAARGILALAREAPAAGEAYNLASGRGTALRDVVAGVLEAAELRVPTCFTGRVRPGDPTRWEGDPARAEALGIRCRIPLDEGLRRTTRWFVESEARAFA